MTDEEKRRKIAATRAEVIALLVKTEDTLRKLIGQLKRLDEADKELERKSK